MAIVGSGAGGAVTAAILAEAGLEVVVLEAGPYMDRRSYPDEPLAALAALYRDGGLTIAEGRPAIPTPVGRAVGGTTVINSGTCFRAPEDVLAGWAREHGVEWASELDPEYEAAEEMLNVRPRRPRADGPKRPALARGRGGAGRPPRAPAPKRRRLPPVQLVPGRLPAGCKTRHARLLSAPRRGGGGAGQG